MDESLISGMDNMGSLIGKDFDLQQLEPNLNDDPTKDIRIQEISDPNPNKSQPTGGRVKGW